MSVTILPCKFCQKPVTFDLDPLRPGETGTRYWKSVYTVKPPAYELEVDRAIKTITYHPNGQIKRESVRWLKEYVFWVYCDAYCSLYHHEQTRKICSAP